ADFGLPWVQVEPFRLFLFSRLDHGHVSEPPRFIAEVESQSFGPQLVANLLEEVDIETSAPHRPEAARSGFVAQVGLGVRGRHENALSREVGDDTAVGRAIAVFTASDKSLGRLDLLVLQCGQLAQLDAPYAGQLLVGIFAPYRGERVR